MAGSLPCRAERCELLESIPLPRGAQRVKTSDPFARFLRSLPLRPTGSPVLLFTGAHKNNQRAHLRVIDMDVGNQDLQQCADALMRLRAEFLYRSGQAHRIAFTMTNGQRVEFSRWQSGERPVLRGQRFQFLRRAAQDSSYRNLRAYLNFVYTYAGTASLERELIRRKGEWQIGDVLIQGGFPGHAIMILDQARSDSDSYVLLGQSFMPAQEFHVLHHPDHAGGWYSVRALEQSGHARTPEWDFPHLNFQHW